MQKYIIKRYQIKKTHKKFKKGIYRTTKGLAYILLYFLTYQHIPDLPFGALVLIHLILIRGIYHLLVGPYNFHKSNRSRKKSRRSSREKRAGWLVLYYYSFVVLILLLSVYIFIIPHLSSFYSLVYSYEWYEWFFIFFAIWIIWVLTIRLTLISLFRSYNLGDRLAKIIHDAGILKTMFKLEKIESKQILLFLSGIVPITGLMILVMFSSILRLVLAGLTYFFFESTDFTSLGERFLSAIFGLDFSLSSLGLPLDEWYSRWLIYLISVVLIGMVSFIRTFASLKGIYRGKLRSPMGRRIHTYREYKKSD